jgi:hypothetical protein
LIGEQRLVDSQGALRAQKWAPVFDWNEGAKMSWTAISWVQQQRLASSSAQFVLLSLALFVDEQGSCFPSQQLLADRTRQSVDTIQRRLVELEACMLIVRFKRVQRGRRRSDEIVLLCDEAAITYAKSLGWDPDDMPSGPLRPSGEPQDIDHQAANCGLENQRHQAAKPAAPYRKSGAFHAAPVRYQESPENNQYRTTNSPQGGKREGGNKSRFRDFLEPIGERESSRTQGEIEPAPAKARGDKEVGDKPPARGASQADLGPGFDEFAQAFPFSMTEPLSPAREQFGLLSPEERAQAVRHAPDYQTACQSAGRKIMSAKRWLAERGFESFAAAARGKGPTLAAMVWVEQDTPEWLEWMRYRKQVLRKGLTATADHRFEDGRIAKGWTFESRRPPWPAGMAPEEDLFLSGELCR